MRTVIFANGLLLNYEAANQVLLPEDQLVAAGGGIRHLQKLKLSPHILIGDLSRLSEKEIRDVKKKGGEVYPFCLEKYHKTDLELALDFVLQAKATKIRIIGGLRGWLDQTLANLFLLMLPELKGIDIRFDDGDQEAFVISGLETVEGCHGDLISLLPLTPSVTGIRTSGLKFPYDDGTLFFQRTKGIKNAILDRKAEIIIQTGCLLCMHTRINCHKTTNLVKKEHSIT